MIQIIFALLMISPSLSIFSIYSVDKNFDITRQIDNDELAHARYENALNKIGWDKLYIYANENVDALSQHRAVGFL